MSSKRRKTVLTLKNKLEIIESLERGEPVNKIAHNYGIGRQTVRDIRNSKFKLEKYVSNLGNTQVPFKRRSMKTAKNPALDEALLQWFNEISSKGTPISGSMCMETAQCIHKSLKLKGSFTASSGWLMRFKQRYGIREMTIMDENGSSIRTLAREQNIPNDNMDEVMLQVKEEEGIVCKVESDNYELENYNEQTFISHESALESVNNLLKYMTQEQFVASDMIAIYKIQNIIDEASNK